MTIEELKKLFIIGKDLSADRIQKRFSLIAKKLFNNFAIKYGNDYYAFNEIEFYFYNRYHKDIITHPRNSEPMQFYVNDFGGIDINFESRIGCLSEKDKANNIITRKFVLDDDAFFGGVLIRQLRKIGNDPELLNGPLKCADLFRYLVAGNLPILVEYSNINSVEEPNRKERKNVRVVKRGKAQMIIDLYNSIGPMYTKDDLNSFNAYSNQKYCYYVN